MARLRFTLGTRHLLNEQVFQVVELLSDNRLLVENLTFGGPAVCLVLTELGKAWAENLLHFEVTGPNRLVAEPPKPPLNVCYTFADFEHLPPTSRQEAWRRYRLILPLLELPAQERTRQFFEDYLASQAKTESDKSRTSATIAEPPPHTNLFEDRGRYFATKIVSVSKDLERFIESLGTLSIGSQNVW